MLMGGTQATSGSIGEKEERAFSLGMCPSTSPVLQDPDL